MSEPKTYYGQWLPSIPGNAQDGSLWEIGIELDDREGVVVNAVIFRGVLMIRDGEVDAEILKARRVYPPGSILPEPRPVMENRRIRDFSGSQWWAIKLDGSWRFVRTTEIEESRDVLYLERHPRAWAITESTLCYPVQHFVDGIFIPRPWPDSGCTTE